MGLWWEKHTRFPNRLAVTSSQTSWEQKRHYSFPLPNLYLYPSCMLARRGGERVGISLVTMETLRKVCKIKINRETDQMQFQASSASFIQARSRKSGGLARWLF